jgi:serine/threonine protein kinase
MMTRAASVRTGSVLESPATGKKFVIGEWVGEGGVGEVWACTQFRQASPALVAKLSRDLVTFCAEVYLADLVQEAKRGFVRMVDKFAMVDRHGPVYVLIQERAENGDLDHYLCERGTPLPQTQAVSEFRHLLNVLELLHAGGGVHRDITPWNVLVDGGGHLLLGDFGIARHSAKRRGVTGETFNEAWVPPEMVKVGRKAHYWGPRQDVWQIGQLLAYALYVGDQPYGEPMVDCREPGQVRYLQCDNWLKEVIYRAIADDDVLRFASAAEMKSALQQRQGFAQSLPVSRPRILKGERIVITGRLESCTKAEGLARARDLGAIPSTEVTATTQYIVAAGNQPLYSAGGAGEKILRAAYFRRGGSGIKQIPGTWFEKLIFGPR